MWRGLHLLVRASAALVALVIVILGLLAARLSAGPLSLTVLIPALTRVVEMTTPLDLQMSDLRLTWRDWRAGLLLQARNVQLRAGDGVGGHFKDVGISFSPEAILTGILVPSIVVAHGGDVILVRNADGTLALPGGLNTSDDSPSTDVWTLSDDGGSSHTKGPLAFLQEVDVGDITLHVKDHSIGSDWIVLLDSVRATRREERLQGQGEVALVFADQRGTVQGSIEEAVDGSGTMQARLQFGSVRPATLAPLLGSPPPAMALDLPLSGQITLRLAADGTLAALDAVIDGGEGTLVVTPALAQAAGMPEIEQKVPVRSLALQGSYAASGPQIDLRKFDLSFAPDAEILLPSPIDQPYRLASLSATGRYGGGRLDLTALNLDLDGPQVTATATLDDVTGAPSGTVDVTATRIPTNDLRRLWPSTLAHDGYVWVTEHLHDGMVPRATAHAELTTKDGVTDVSAFRANFDVEGLTVDYKPPMPVARNVHGRAQADLKNLTITVDGGEVEGLSVGGGTITLLDLTRDVPDIAIDLQISGPVRDTMKVLAPAPIDYPRDIILPEQVSGTQSTRLRMTFPLRDDIDVEDLQLLVLSEIKDLGITNVVPGLDVSNGHLKLWVDPEILTVRGPVEVGGIVSLIDIRQALDSDADPQTQAELITENASVSQLKRHIRSLSDVDPAEIDDYLLSGTFDALLRARLDAHGVGQIDGTFDLGATTVALPELNWRKDTGHPATLEVNAAIENEKLQSIPRFRLTAPKLNVDARITLNGEGGLAHADVREFTFGRTALSATISQIPQNGWDILLTGDALDLGPLLDQAERSGGDSATSLANVPKLTFAADLKKVWLRSADPITDAAATVVHDHGLWSLIQMQGTLKQGSTVEFLIAPDASETGRSLLLEANNAGETLQVFGLSSDVVGGRIQAEGHFDDTDPDHPLSGRLRVRSFHLINAPTLARMLNLMSLSGIGDALTGRGIFFNALDLPFGERRRVISIYNGRAFGSMLGITGTGTIDLNAGQVDMRGELVPFYTVNALFGRIPLLGPVLTGGERGGGVISATYHVSGTADNPRVRVNPISVLFPGFVRWILETFQGWLGIGNNPVSETLIGEP